MSIRDQRQSTAHAWAARCFGKEVVGNRAERAKRILEEAIELAQAEGVPLDDALRIVYHVFKRPPGNPEQEVGGIAVTLLVYCETAGLSADVCEAFELNRILRMPDDHFRARHKAKADAGIAMAPAG